MRSLAARDYIAHEAPTAPESASGDSSVQGSPGSSGSSLAVMAREAATLASQSARFLSSSPVEDVIATH
jgi:hypothetical protein